MRTRRTLTTIALLAGFVLPGGCAQRQESEETADRAPEDNRQLLAICEADQSDRSGDSAIDWTAVGPRG